jgi:acyl-CoA reductase-like NAD-dependent aldehyde dehydrogenase
MDAGDLLDVDVLGPRGTYRSRAGATIEDVGGAAVARLSLAPVPYVARAMSALRAAGTPATDERLSALRAAGERFRSGIVAELTPERYAHLVARVSGLGISTVTAAMGKIEAYCRDAGAIAGSARPADAFERLDDGRATAGGALWVRRGEVFGVHAAGNHPAVHADWIQALALGYCVAVRPSRREPFTAHRLVTALRDCGFGPDQVAFLPTDYDGADEMLRHVDRALVYGGDGVVEKYRGKPSVLAMGPGRSKILVTRDVDAVAHADLIADSVLRGGGVGCTNATAVLVDGDAAGVAEAVAAKLATVRSLPPEHPDAVLPVQPLESARRLESYARSVTGDAKAVLGGAGVVDELGDGSAALRPAVFLLPSANARQTRIELSFPCVWIAPWSASDGIGPLRDTLALSVLSEDDDLIRSLVLEPSIRNVYVGAHPTYWSSPQAPHDGYLADFLMESKGFVRSGLPQFT